jgi:AmmeMemoRadiSam system protein B
MLEARRPAVAGRFYPGDADALEREVERYMQSDRPPTPAIAVIGPHAGYMYSGAILGETYAPVEIPGRVLIMCPNHTGRGARRSLWSGGPWQLPGGDLEVDQDLTGRLAEGGQLVPDTMAHVYEHSIEVHLPFLRARRPDVRIVPICLGSLSVEDCRELGESIAAAIRELGEDVLVAASTDMSHYIPADRARELDGLALERAQALDPVGLHAVVRDKNISMCGYVPTTVALFAANALGAKTVQLVRYGSSGEASGDYDRVVGYAGLIVT